MLAGMEMTAGQPVGGDPGRRRMLRRLCMPAIGAALVALWLPAGGGGAAGLPNGEIVFARSAEVNSSTGAWVTADLYVMAPDGTRLRLLARNAAQPAVSPDARRIAFVRGFAIWVMNRDGSGQKQLTSPVRRKVSWGWDHDSDSAPAWSQDGKTLYFSRWSNTTYTGPLYAVTIADGRVRQLTYPAPSEHGHCQDNPALSPNGRTLAYDETLDCEHGWFTHISAITTTGQRTTLPFRFPRLSVVSEAAWAPGGNRLAYAVQGDSDSAIGGSGVYISAANGSPPERIAASFVSAPAWSADGRSIVYATYVGSNDDRDIWLTRTDGTGGTPLTQTRADDTDPAWLPAAH